MTFSKFLQTVEFYTGNRNWFEKSGLSLNQHEIADIIHQNSYSLIHKGRRDGVSTILGLYILWRALETPGLTIALITPTRDSREVFRQNLNWNVSRLGLRLEPDSHDIKKTVFGNGSRIIYGNQNGRESISPLRGHCVDILVFDDVEFTSVNSERYFMDCIVSVPAGRKNSKVIISASNGSIKNILNRFSTIPFQEIYGHFFNGKREVLIEKITHRKS